MTRPISELDVRAGVVEAQAVACRVLAEAAAHTASPSDQIAYAYDQWLITHPDTQLATDADYPGWAEHIAALQATNPRQNAHKETSK